MDRNRKHRIRWEEKEDASGKNGAGGNFYRRGEGKEGGEKIQHEASEMDG